jgi:protein TonB
MAFEAVLGAERLAPSGARRVTITVSLLLHAVALAVGVAYSFWHVDELPLPTVAVSLAGGAPPPPPPPPPARHHASTTPNKTRPTEVRPKTELVQPTERPKETPKPSASDDQDSSDDDKEGGEEGGVEGGVKGGVVGGVVGAPPVNQGPKMLPPQVGGKQLLIDPNSDPYKVGLPPPLARGGMSFFAILRICVSTEGTVTDVKVLRGADPAIDPQIPTVLRRWRYRPYTLDGRPVPFCYMLRYEISAR